MYWSQTESSKCSLDCVSTRPGHPLYKASLTHKAVFPYLSPGRDNRREAETNGPVHRCCCPISGDKWPCLSLLKGYGRGGRILYSAAVAIVGPRASRFTEIGITGELVSLFPSRTTTRRLHRHLFEVRCSPGLSPCGGYLHNPSSHI